MSPAIALALMLSAGHGDSSAPRLLDDFERIEEWTAHPADGVEVALHADRGHTGGALRMDFDFKAGGGYAIMRRPLAIDLPANYAITFWLRGKAPPNTLEFKFVDASGDNVWWYTEPDRSFDPAWQKVTIRKRQISFAWGPLGGGELTHAAALELVITAGKGGGQGSVWFDDLVLTPLPVLGPYDVTPGASVGSARPGFPATAMVDGDTGTAWRSAEGTRQDDVTVDFQRPREFGGITLLWQQGRGGRDYDVLLSDDRRQWRTVRRVRGGNGGRDDLYLPDSECRYLRLLLRAPLGATGYGIREVVVQPLAYGASRNAFFASIAGAEPAGTYPRYWSGRRAYWTVIGVDGAREEALINEDGAIEAGKGAFSVEPFLTGGGFRSWNDVQTTVSLEDGVLPIPTVRWNAGNLSLGITAFATGPDSSSSVIVRYRVINTGTTTTRPTLALAVRPFQVNPPWQFLNTPGGATRIDSLRWSGVALKVNGDRAVVPLDPPGRVAVSSFDGGDIVARLREGHLPVASRVSDSFGAASAVLTWPLRLAPGDSAEVDIEIPLVPGGRPNLRRGDRAMVEQAMNDIAGAWHRTLDSTRIDLPPSGQHLARTIQSTLAWILINRDGPAIQPGSRSYERSWIRDGALTSAALLRFGHPQVVREFIDWYAGFQYPNGKVPCCVDTRGADPVPEHDSNGEFIYLVMEYWRHTGDTSLLQAMWPHVAAAVEYLDSLRHTRRTREYQTGDPRVFFGLLPPSISHEGYSAKPMHSYWDDFFALRGFKDATAMAIILGHESEAARYAKLRDEFRSDLLASLELVRAQHQIDFLPGAADLGDFDATSTTIAVTPVGEEAMLPRAALDATFERYWKSAMGRLDDSATWEAYTPYELRTVGTMLRLGWKDRALALLRMFLDDQEPPAWNQWPEVVWHDRRAPKFIGDSPHTWVGSDFLRSVADLFGYERESDSALVVGAGLDEAWLEGPGVRVARLGTWWGPLSYTARRSGDSVEFAISEGIRLPPGGIRLSSPRAARPKTALVDGTPVTLDGGSAVTLSKLPTRVVFEY